MRSLLTVTQVSGEQNRIQAQVCQMLRPRLLTTIPLFKKINTAKSYMIKFDFLIVEVDEIHHEGGNFRTKG